MENTIQISANVKGNYYKIDGGSNIQAWDYVNDVMVSDFGFKFWGVGTTSTYKPLTITSIFNIINITPITFVNSEITITNNNVIWVNNQLHPFTVDPTLGIPSDVIFNLTYESNDVNCLDILGNEVNVFEFNDDGVIYGDNNITPISPKQSINYNCCQSLGYYFDSNLAKCLWKTPCVDNSPIKLILNSVGDDNSIFSVNDNENCKLDVELDYLLKLNCDSILNCLGDGKIIDFLSGITINIGLEIEVDNPKLSKAKNVVVSNLFSEETIFLTYLFNGYEILNYLGDINSGVMVYGDNCDVFLDKLNFELSQLGNTTSVNLNSNFLHFKTTINNIENIINKKIKLSLLINKQSCNFSLLVDNVKLNKICEVIDRKEVFVNTNPSFELDKVIDNKKTWVAKDIAENRYFDLANRNTDYDLNHRKLALNSKEIETEISNSNPIETHIKSNIINNEIMNELIDVKSRKTINSYPKNRMLFDEYLNNNELIFNGGVKYNYSTIFKYISSIDTNWVNLVEQVIPSTTIWGSIYKYSNVKYDSCKFKYKKYNLETCTYCQKSDVLGETAVGGEYISSLREFKDSLTGENVSEYNDFVFTKNINDSSIFLGSVVILGEPTLEAGINNGSNIILINENI